eukprot:m.214081 g.214081  ORF g.214081 m.214081 type:complete len:385 (+) comp18617_c0_seq3:4390-5544(+)
MPHSMVRLAWLQDVVDNLGNDLNSFSFQFCVPRDVFGCIQLCQALLKVWDHGSKRLFRGIVQRCPRLCCTVPIPVDVRRSLCGAVCGDFKFRGKPLIKRRFQRSSKKPNSAGRSEITMGADSLFVSSSFLNHLAIDFARNTFDQTVQRWVHKVQHHVVRKRVEVLVWAGGNNVESFDEFGAHGRVNDTVCHHNFVANANFDVFHASQVLFDARKLVHFCVLFSASREAPNSANCAASRGYRRLVRKLNKQVVRVVASLHDCSTLPPIGHGNFDDGKLRIVIAPRFFDKPWRRGPFSFDISVPQTVDTHILVVAVNTRLPTVPVIGDFLIAFGSVSSDLFRVVLLAAFARRLVRKRGLLAHCGGPGVDLTNSNESVPGASRSMAV